MSLDNDKVLWKKIVAQISAEWQDAPLSEKDWIEEHVQVIARLQQELHRLFLDVDGAAACHDCAERCCGHGRFHPGLANVLACVVAGVPLPLPDFGRDCPYSNDEGCLFAPAQRPYNCISFICDEVEPRLGPKSVQFYLLEKQIRAEYEQFAQRYVGGSMRGLILKGELPHYLTRK
ncbi:MAG: hypothetical protein C0615_12335 [Desulfuromonas sp.]|nr:MAG: hypothetical protein C0615_12335 [Desulfuromonas sp.]